MLRAPPGQWIVPRLRAQTRAEFFWRIFLLAEPRAGIAGLSFGRRRQWDLVDVDSASKLRKTTKLTTPRAPRRKAAPDLLRRVRMRLDGAVLAGAIDHTATLRLRGDLQRLALLQRLVRRRPRAPLAGRG